MMLDISRREIKSLKEYFSKYKENIDDIDELCCDNNQLASLEGCPESLVTLSCYNNHLTTLEGCPKNVSELFCHNNLLTSLQGCPKSVNILYCWNNLLTTLQGCPESVTELDCWDNKLIDLYNIKTVYQIHQINSIIDKFTENIKKNKIIINFNFLKNIWLQDFYKPDGMYVQLTDIYFL